MKKMIYTCIVIIFTLLGIFSLISCELINGYSIQIIDEVKPGPYKVGFQRFTWEDKKRKEIYSLNKNDYRTVVLDIFYPTETEQDGPDDSKDRLSICKSDPFKLMSSHLMGVMAVLLCYDPIRVTATMDAPISSLESSYPVLIYLHGINCNRHDNTLLIDFLVSHGYAVIAIDSPYIACVTNVNGKHIWANVPMTALYPGIYNAMEVQAKDAIFVLDQLEESYNSSNFEGRLNLGKVGIFGTSLGGGAATWALANDTRIDSIINIDGPNHTDALHYGLNKPACWFSSNTMAFIPDIPGCPSLSPFNEKLWDTIPTGNYIHVKNTGHGNYQDLCHYDDGWVNILKLTTLYLTTMCGCCTPQEDIDDILHVYSLAWWHKHLKNVIVYYGSSNKPLLDEWSSDFPTVSKKLFRSK